MGEGADMGGAEMGGEMGGAMGGADAADVSTEAPSTDAGMADTGMPTTGEGGTGGGMLSFAVSDSMMNQGAGTAPSTAGIASPTTDVSGAATTPVNSTGSGSGDIERKNPFGGDVGKTEAEKPKLTFGQNFKKVSEGYEEGKKAVGGNGADSGPAAIPQINTTYNALFGSSMGRSQAPAMNMPAIQNQGVAATSAPIAPMISMPSAPAAPSPMQINTSAPPIAPQIPLGMAVSDSRAKTNIRKANADIEQLLQKVYDNFSNKGKK